MMTTVPLFVTTVWLMTGLPVLPDPAPLTIGVPLALFGLSSEWSRPACTVFLGVLLICHFAQTGAGNGIPDDLIGRDIHLKGKVSDLPERREGMVRFRFRVESVEGEPSDWSGTVILSWRDSNVPLKPGDRFILTARIRPPGTSLNPGLFDYEGWLYARGISGTGYVRTDQQVVRLEPERWDVLHHLARDSIRTGLVTRSRDPAVAGLLTALAIGESAGISVDDWRVLSRTGTNHLLIISGLHVGIVAGFFLKLLSMTPLSIRQAAPAAMVFVTGYAFLAGFGLPVQRALVMSAVVLLALGIRRRVSTLVLFNIALLMIVLTAPLAVLNTGFWLSFGAVLALIYAFGGRIELVPGGWRQWLLVALRTQWVIFVIMLPLLLYLVHQISITAFLVNLVAIPVITFFVIPWLLGFVVLMPFNTVLASVCLSVAGTSLSWLWKGLEWVAAQRWVLSVTDSGFAPYLIACGGCLVFFLPKGLVPRWPAVFCLLPLFTLEPHILPGRAQVVFVDVGQGLSVIVRTARSSLVYDAGPRFGKRFDSGEQIVTPMLRRLGITYLDTLIISHGDNDHAGGAVSLKGNFSVGRTISPVIEGAMSCVRPRKWTVDGVVFEVFSLPVRERSGNDASCLLMVTGPGYRVLLTGDIEAGAERLLLDSETSPVTLLSVPHHGSRSSSLPGFINRFQPDLAVVSAGYGNRFHHPDPGVVKRYQRRHVRVLNTATSGAITVELGPQGIDRIEEARVDGRRFWHRIR